MAVEGGSLIRIPPINQTVIEGEPAFFFCVVKVPDLAFAVWHKDGIPLSDLQDLSTRSVISSDGSLTINPTVGTDLGIWIAHNIIHEYVEKTDSNSNVQHSNIELKFLSGEFVCKVHSVENDFQEARAYLNVQCKFGIYSYMYLICSTNH